MAAASFFMTAGARRICSTCREKPATTDDVPGDIAQRDLVGDDEPWRAFHFRRRFDAVEDWLARGDDGTVVSPVFGGARRGHEVVIGLAEASRSDFTPQYSQPRLLRAQTAPAGPS